MSTVAAQELRKIARHNTPVKFDIRRRSIVAYDVQTGVIVAQFPLKCGVDGRAVVRDIVSILLDSGEAEIHAVEGEDVDEPLTFEGAKNS